MYRDKCLGVFQSTIKCLVFYEISSQKTFSTNIVCMLVRLNINVRICIVCFSFNKVMYILFPSLLLVKEYIKSFEANMSEHLLFVTFLTNIYGRLHLMRCQCEKKFHSTNLDYFLSFVVQEFYFEQEILFEIKRSRVFSREQHAYPPPYRIKLSFWSYKMSNVLKCLQKNIFRFQHISLTQFSISVSRTKSFSNKNFRCKNVLLRFRSNLDGIRFRRFYENENLKKIIS